MRSCLCIQLFRKSRASCVTLLLIKYAIQYGVITCCDASVRMLSEPLYCCTAHAPFVWRVAPVSLEFRGIFARLTMRCIPGQDNNQRVFDV